jgi:hypothetical protein
MRVRGALDATDPASPPGDTPRSAAGPGGKPRPWRRLRLAIERTSPRSRLVVGWSVFSVAFVLFVAFIGLPYSEDDLLIWLTAALFVASLGDPGRWRRGLIRDWLPLYAVLAVYALLRGYASHVLWGPFVKPQVAFDRFIGGGAVPTVTLQRWLFNANHLHPWDYLVWLTYMSHFFTSFIVAGVLWKRDHARFRRFVPIFVGLTFLGYVTYVLYPAMPPWLASQTGHIGKVTRIIPVVWNHVGIHGAAFLFTGGNKFDNNIAAVPSLHAAYPMLLLLFFWKRARRPLRVLLVTYVLAMAFTLVYTGEHFVIDEVIGWAYAITAFLVGSRLLDRWQARQRRVRLNRSDNSAVTDPRPIGANQPDGQLVTAALSTPASTVTNGHQPTGASG